MIEHAQVAPPVLSPQAEAARYALLRRLAPSIRHHLVVNLQPIGMIYEVMDRRLKAAQPDLAEVQESAHKINGFARAALDSCLDVVTWLAPDEHRLTTAAEGVRECLGLLATSLTFRGFTLRNEVAAVKGDVSRAAVRTVLTASLLYLTDNNTAPAEIALSAACDADSLVFTITLRVTDGAGAFGDDVPYRRLQWADVEALAAADGVTLDKQGKLQLRLAVPLAGT